MNIPEQLLLPPPHSKIKAEIVLETLKRFDQKCSIIIILPAEPVPPAPELA